MGLVVQLLLLLFVCICGAVGLLVDELRTNGLFVLLLLILLVFVFFVSRSGGVENKKEL